MALAPGQLGRELASEFLLCIYPLLDGIETSFFDHHLSLLVKRDIAFLESLILNMLLKSSQTTLLLDHILELLEAFDCLLSSKSHYSVILEGK